MRDFRAVECAHGSASRQGLTGICRRDQGHARALAAVSNRTHSHVHLSTGGGAHLPTLPTLCADTCRWGHEALMMKLRSRWVVRYLVNTRERVSCSRLARSALHVGRRYMIQNIRPRTIRRTPRIRLSLSRLQRGAMKLRAFLCRHTSQEIELSSRVTLAPDAAHSASSTRSLSLASESPPTV